MKHPLDSKLKKLDGWDISLGKISVFFFTLFLLKLIPPLMNWTYNTNMWIFLVIALIVAIRPVKKAWF